MCSTKVKNTKAKETLKKAAHKHRLRAKLNIVQKQ